MKKIIIPLLSLLALAAIIGVIVFMNVKDRKFELPGRMAIEGEIKNHGYEVGLLDMSKYKSIGIDSKYIKIWATLSDKEENDKRDVNISYASFDTAKDAAKAFDNYYAAGMYIKKKSQYKGNVKLYFDEEKAKGYVLYNINGVMEDLVTDYAMAQTNDIDFFNPKSRFLYGGIYLDGSRIVFFTTSEPTKTYVINEMMDKYELPKPWLLSDFIHKSGECLFFRKRGAQTPFFLVIAPYNW